MGFRAGFALFPAVIAAPALASTTNWDGQWAGRISSGASVSITVAGGKVTEYHFGNRSVSIAFGEVTPDRVSFSPGSAAIITLTPAGQNAADYSFVHPQMGKATGRLTRMAARAAPTATAPARIPATWFGTWGRPNAMLITVSESGIAYKYQGTSYTVAGIRADNGTLAFDILPAARLSLRMAPDQRADYSFTLNGTTTQGRIWRARMP